MIHERFPEQFPHASDLRERKRRSIARADRIICISEATKQDLLHFFPEAADKTSVVYLASSLTDISARPDASRLPGEYLLYVGARSGYKNFALFCDAMAMLPPTFDRLHVVCFGGGKLTSVERARSSVKALGHRILQVSGGDDALKALYKGAAALVYPSIYEGFGIPVCEAMSLGCPVICTPTSSLPEVAGTAAEYFDSGDAESLASAIDRVLTDGGRKEELRNAGLRQARRFSWDACASETAAVYRELTSHSG
jgi:glycosyltransferase involved in cell wall biosynthesis